MKRDIHVMLTARQARHLRMMLLGEIDHAMIKPSHRLTCQRIVKKLTRAIVESENAT
jgi:hypothetical protein